MIAVSLLCASATAWAGTREATSVRALLAHEPGHDAEAPHADDHDHDHDDDDHHVDEDHPGHVPPAANEGDDGMEEGHGEGREEEGAAEGGTEEAVEDEASAAWTVPAPLVVAAAAAALIAGM